MKQDNGKNKTLHWARFLVAFFALLVAATHLSSAIPSGSAPAVHITNQSSGAAYPSHSYSSGFNALGLWIDIETIAYAIIAVIFLLGIRTWYVPSTIFNAFNIALYFLSGFIAIPGITGGAFANHLNVLSSSPVTQILVVSWIASLVLMLALLKYDPGTELDKLLVTKK